MKPQVRAARAGFQDELSSGSCGRFFPLTRCGSIFTTFRPLPVLIFFGVRNSANFLSVVFMASLLAVQVTAV